MSTNKFKLTSSYTYSFVFAVVCGILIYILYPSICSYLYERGIDNLVNAFFLIGIIVYLVNKNKDLLFKLKIKPSIIPGIGLIFVSFILLYVNRSNPTFLLTGVSFLFCILGLLILNIGFFFLKYLIIPVIFLAIGFDIFEVFLMDLSYYFQLSAASIASILLNTTGILSIQSGILLYLPHITLSVEPSCNGINHLSALVLIALIIVFTRRKSLKHNIILPVSAFLLGFLLNGVRVTLIGLWALFFHGEWLHGPGNVFYVTFVFSIGAVILLLISFVFSSRDKKLSKLKNLTTFKIDKKQLFQAQIVSVTILIVGVILIEVLF